MSAVTTLTSSTYAATRRHPATLALLVSAQFLVMLDASIVNVALPSIQSDLGFGPASITWVVNAYVLAFGGLLLLSGRFADMFGRRRVFVAGSSLFTVGTLLAATAGGQEQLLAGRLVQGVGAAALSPAAMSLLLSAFPGEQRARAMATWGAASALGGATGVMAGGLLAGSFGWRSVFLVTVPFSCTAAFVARHLLAESALSAARRFDVVGAATVTGAVIALVHGAVDAVDLGWDSPRVLITVAGAVVFAGGFVAVERRVPDPLVPLELFRSRALSRGVALAVLGAGARASSFVLVALYFQQALAMAPREAGLAMVPTSVAGFAISMTVLPRLLKAVEPQRLVVVGLVVLAAGHLWLANVSQHGGYALGVLPGLILVAAGVALSFTPTTMVVAASVPEAHAGLASGLAATASQVGGALGTATFIVVGLSVADSGSRVLGPAGFSAAFTAAAAVALGTAALGARGLFAAR